MRKITGDLSQIDLPPNIKSGLKDAIEVLEKISGISIIRFSGNDIIRHPMVTRIVNAYDKREGNHLYEVPAELDNEKKWKILGGNQCRLPQVVE